MIAPKNADNKQRTAVSSTSGNLRGYLYWSSAEKLYLLVFRDPSDPRARRRLKKRVPDEDHARRLLDDAEEAWKEAVNAAREKDVRPQFLTPEQQEDALRAIGLLGGRLSLTEAVTALLSVPELKKAAAMPDPRALQKTLHGILDRGARLSPPGGDTGEFKLTDRTTIREAIDAFFQHKRKKGATAATLLTYETRLRWLLIPDVAIRPLKIELTKTLIARICLGLKHRTAYGFLTAVSSFETFLFETKGFIHHEPVFSILPIREAASFFSREGTGAGIFFKIDRRRSMGHPFYNVNDRDIEEGLCDNRFVRIVREWMDSHPEDDIRMGTAALRPAHPDQVQRRPTPARPATKQRARVGKPKGRR